MPCSTAPAAAHTRPTMAMLVGRTARPWAPSRRPAAAAPLCDAARHRRPRLFARAAALEVDAAREDPDVTSSTDEEDLLALAELAEEEVQVAKAGATQLGGRGVVVTQPVQRQCVVSIPMRHVLAVSDDPLGAISVFGDGSHEAWQAAHAGACATGAA